MVRPERIVECGDSRCIELAGESPVAVSAAAPRSRPRASRETLPSEWGVKSPQLAVGLAGGEQVHRPSRKRTLQPREINTRKGRAGRAAHVTAKATDCTWQRIGAGRPRGMEEGMWTGVGYGTGETRSRLLTFSEGGPYKPMAKAERAGRESEGFIVPTKPVKAGGGKEPCFGCGRVWR